jgi:hypothetical protein
MCGGRKRERKLQEGEGEGLEWDLPQSAWGGGELKDFFLIWDNGVKVSLCGHG